MHSTEGPDCGAPTKSRTGSKCDRRGLHSKETGGSRFESSPPLEPRERGWQIPSTIGPSSTRHTRNRVFTTPSDDQGQPLGLPPVGARRPSKFIVPVPTARRGGAAAQGALPLETYSDNAIINEIRGHVDAWRDLSGGADWGVTPTTQRLLEHWRSSNFAGSKRSRLRCRPHRRSLRPAVTRGYLSRCSTIRRCCRLAFPATGSATCVRLPRTHSSTWLYTCRPRQPRPCCNTRPPACYPIGAGACRRPLCPSRRTAPHPAGRR